MEQYFKIISTCCYVRDKERGKVLMLYRNKKDSVYDKRIYRGLGGKAEQGESPIECVKREIKEEAGIDIDPVWKGIATFSKSDGRDWEAHIFIADGFKGELIKSDEGELCWIDENKLADLDMPEADKELMPLLFKDEKFHVHAKYGVDKKLVSLKIDKI